MTYNIGDMVVRYSRDHYLWDMVGIIINSRKVYEGKTFYKIKWADPELDTCSEKWQAHEFDLIEVAKKLDKKT